MREKTLPRDGVSRGRYRSWPNEPRPRLCPWRITVAPFRPAVIPDVQNSLGRAANEIHSRPGRERPEEFVAEPLDKRLERWKRPELPGSPVYRKAWMV